MAVTATLLGVGEAFDAAEPNSAALVEAHGFTLLVDCGHSVVAPLWRARPDPDGVDAVFLTHLHADHVLGLLPVLDRWGCDGRRKPLLILTAQAGIAPLQRLLDAGSVPWDARSPFPIAFQPAEDARRIGPFAAAVAPTQHAVPNHAIRLDADGRRFAFSGDGRPTEASRALFAGADLLLHECYMPAAADDLPFHCDLPTVQAIAGPQRIGLYHVRAGQRDALRAAVAGDSRLFVPEAGATLQA